MYLELHAELSLQALNLPDTDVTVQTGGRERSYSVGSTSNSSDASNAVLVLGAQLTILTTVSAFSLGDPHFLGAQTRASLSGFLVQSSNELPEISSGLAECTPKNTRTDRG
jgi:hypothetical protein